MPMPRVFTLPARPLPGLLCALLFASACQRESEPPAPGAGRPGDRLLILESVVRGARVYQEHCAICHGPEAQGHPDWQTPGVAAAPPLDGSGNAPKRRRQELVAIIRNGATRDGLPVMPGWKGRLRDQEVEDVIAWFQALWPAELYENWRRANVGTPTGG
mgnify:CR=1 FL=1